MSENRSNIFQQAIALRKKLGEDTTSPIDIFSLAHNIPDLTLVVYPMGNNISGMCIKADFGSIIAINSSMSIGRQRFSLAHEMYHLYYDEVNLKTICFQKIGTGNLIEKSADEFASLFLMPLIDIIDNSNDFPHTISIEQIVTLEQKYGLSRQAVLYRLTYEGLMTINEANCYRQNVIDSALRYGYTADLYKPTPKEHQYGTYGHYIRQANNLLNQEIISDSKYEELMLSAFRPDLVYGDNDIEEGELND